MAVTKDEIRLGDVVRLKVGATVTVEGVWDSFTDAEGFHEGPFVSVRGTSEYRLLSDVVEVVERNERVCVFCGGGITSTNPETDFCRDCFYGGEHLRRSLSTEPRNLLGAIAALDEVVSAGVWHTGGGCFNVAVTLADGRLLTPSEGFRDDDGQVWVEPGISFATDLGTKWGIVVSANADAWSEWNEDDGTLAIAQALFTDAELVEAIRKIATESKTVAEAATVAEAVAPRKLVATVVAEQDEIAATMRELLGEADHGRVEGDSVFFDPPLIVYDVNDADDGPLFVLHASTDGEGVQVFAPNCPTFAELERRIVRSLGEGWTIDDHDDAVETNPR